MTVPVRGGPRNPFRAACLRPRWASVGLAEPLVRNCDLFAISRPPARLVPVKIGDRRQFLSTTGGSISGCRSIVVVDVIRPAGPRLARHPRPVPRRPRNTGCVARGAITGPPPVPSIKLMALRGSQARNRLCPNAIKLTFITVMGSATL